jgi:hypothetical protein
VNIRDGSCEGDGNLLDLSKLVGSLDMLLYNGLIVLIEFGFDEFRIVVDRASETNAEIFAGFGFNIRGFPLAGDLT